MPKTNGYVPAYRLHKPSGQANVILNGRHVYLGPFGSAESREKYARLLAELPTAAQPNRSLEALVWTGEQPSINELILRYWAFAESYYAKDGRPTKEQSCIREARRPPCVLGMRRAGCAAE